VSDHPFNRPRVAGCASAFDNSLVEPIDRCAAAGFAEPGNEGVQKRAKPAQDHRDAKTGRNTEMFAVSLTDFSGMIEEEFAEHI
jgi:hypothetical protein